MSRFDAVLAVTLMLAAGGASAQDVSIPQEATIASEENWGTTADTYVSVLAHELQLVVGTEGAANTSTFARSCAAPPCLWAGGVHLPNGAQIMSLDVSACDSSATANVGFALRTVPRTPGPVGTIVSAQTGTAGCIVSQVPISPAPQVSNVNNGYLLQVTADAGVTWTQLRVRYRLQVSAGPAVASFPLDVPTTHPLFRFVEAMAASGLTGGCATDRFCPDTPVTRGQLAVFLATALGLHFPG